MIGIVYSLAGGEYQAYGQTRWQAGISNSVLPGRRAGIVGPEGMYIQHYAILWFNDIRREVVSFLKDELPLPMRLLSGTPKTCASHHYGRDLGQGNLLWGELAEERG